MCLPGEANLEAMLFLWEVTVLWANISSRFIIGF